MTSDLEEGKETLLTVYTREHGSQQDKEFIASLIGKHPISIGELAKAQQIFRDIGAVADSEQQAEELVQKGKKALAGLDLKPDIKVLLAELADHIISRTT